ncbi:hypothetical protein, partial [Gelidibacter salicanalis]|uniref:hypothetical protein n=1 Tax=Gelidibacter salicanalis TaxID=291193 RepID=UPI001F2637EA
NEAIEAVRDFVAKDRRHTITEMTASLKLSRGTVSRILHNDLSLVKKSARWVPRLLSIPQKLARVKAAEAFKKLEFMRGKAFIRSIVTMDESAVSFFTPESKAQSKQW